MRELSDIDLNLLVILEQLLTHRSTSEVARRLGKTQSAISHSLRKLRGALDDPLFVRGGATLRPTTRAQALEQPLRRALGQLSSALSGTAESFDPARVKRAVVIGATDFAEQLLLRPLVDRISQEAPDVDVHLRAAGDDVERAIQGGEIDLGLGAGFRERAGVIIRGIYREQFVCVMRHDHPMGDELTLERFLEVEHILVTPRGLPGSFVDNALAELGERRKVRMQLPHFVTAQLLAAQTDLVATLPLRLAQHLAELVPVTLAKPPLELPEFTFSMIFGEQQQQSPFHRWFRQIILETLADPILGPR